MSAARVASARATPLATPRLTVAAVGALTAIAFALRVPGIDQSLFADELFTERIATAHRLDDVLPAMQLTENNPPLFYFLAWAMAQLGDPTVWIRVPSLILGTATVPAVYVLGRKTVGRAAGLVAAAFMALSPFAIFYSSEGRAYATAVFLTVVATLLLLEALERRVWPWWLGYGVAATLILYAHYTGVFVLGAHAAWAFWNHRERARELALVYGLVALSYAPWLPHYRDQKEFFGFDKIGAPISLDSVFTGSVSALFGHPYIRLRTFPGSPALELLAVAVPVVVAAVVAAVLVARPKATEERRSRPIALIALVAFAAPVALIGYSLLGPDIWQARNLSVSLPALYLLIAALLVRLPRPAAVAGGALVLAVLAIGAVKSVDPDYQRPPLKQAAERIDARARPGDPVVDLLFQGNTPGLRRGLVVNFDRPHRVYPFDDPDAAWRKAAAGAHVFLVVPQVGPLRGTPQRSGPGNRYRLRSARIYRGFMQVGVFEFAR